MKQLKDLSLTHKPIERSVKRVKGQMEELGLLCPIVLNPFNENVIQTGTNRYLELQRQQYDATLCYKPIDAKVQLSYVLPRTSLYLLPNNIKKRLMSSYSEIYKDNWEFEWSYCKYFWESHAIMPHIDINKLENIVLGDQ